MDELAKKVTDLIQANFDGADVNINPISESKVSGTILWDGFDEQRQAERQQKLWNILRSNLSPQQQMGIATFLTFTQMEVEEMQETLAV